jgi:hypothetical protein
MSLLNKIENIINLMPREYKKKQLNSMKIYELILNFLYFFQLNILLNL